MSKAFDQFIHVCKQIKPILQEIIDNGGTPYMVGGTVRDIILDKPLKDADIEVHGISIESLEQIFKKFGPVRLVGVQFGVLRIDGLDIDWSIPRRDSKGRKPTVEFDPTMTIELACKRRDITMNAMAIDLKFVCKNFEQLETIFTSNTTSLDIQRTLQIIDPYGGLDDIKNKRLRAVDNKLFTEDPLRFFRVMHFIGRFEMEPDAELNDICKKMSLADSETGRPLAKERIYEEIRKLFLKSQRPSKGFRWLEKLGRLNEIFPEIFDLTQTPQRPDRHPEGNVFEHSMQALDAAAQLETYQNEEEKFLITLASLCHDFGKPSTTDEALSCKGHANAGVGISKQFLKRLMDNSKIINGVCKLVKYHTIPYEFIKIKASIKSYKKMALKLSPEANLKQLALVAQTDRQGRNDKSCEPLKIIDDDLLEFVQTAEKAQILFEPEKPVLLGRNLLDDVKPGKKMGELLKKAYEIQIEEGITDWQILKQRVLKA